MNSFKPLITIAVLGGIGYFVYSKLNSQPSAPPPGAPSSWDSAPTVQMPGDGDAKSKWSGLGGNTNSLLPPASVSTGSAPPNTAGTTAPTFSSTPSTANPPASVTAPAVDTQPNGGAAPVEDVTRLIPPASAEEKWGTTDPSAAVTKLIPPAVASYGDSPAPPAAANYGDAPATNAETANTDAYPTIPADAAANGGAANNSYGSADPADVGKQFQAAWEKGNKLLEEGKLVEGLAVLSIWHEHPRLSATENQQLTDLLDQVAGTVVYSTQSYTEPPHIVKQGERLEDIGQQYNVPWQLIAKINDINDPASLQPGEQLKVLRGPFGAVIQIEKRQLTLLLNNMYAGRFLIGIGRDMPPREGTVTVTEKVANPVYHGRERTINADDPANPLGERWIALGGDMGIHGVGPLTDIGSTNQPGSISLGQRDIEDVFDILSVGSKVMIIK